MRFCCSSVTYGKLYWRLRLPIAIGRVCDLSLIRVFLGPAVFFARQGCRSDLTLMMGGALRALWYFFKELASAESITGSLSTNSIGSKLSSLGSESLPQLLHSCSLLVYCLNSNSNASLTLTGSRLPHSISAGTAKFCCNSNARKRSRPTVSNRAGVMCCPSN